MKCDLTTVKLESMHERLILGLALGRLIDWFEEGGCNNAQHALYADYITAKEMLDTFNKPKQLSPTKIK